MIVRFWVSCLLLALLGGCFTSETPRIPAAELARPEGLAGDFWYLSLRHDSGLMAYLVGIDAKPDGTFEQSRGDSARFRLVRLVGDTVYLFISDAEHGDVKDDNLSAYYLLQRQPGGAWEWDDVSVNYAGPFAGQNAAYLNGVMARHGMTLSSPEERTRIVGPVHGQAVPQLFRDPAFLGALLVTPVGAYLPARPGLIPSDGAGLGPSARINFELELAGTVVPSPGELAKPEGFAGSYVLSADGDVSHARIDARPDGRFDLRGGNRVDTLALLAVDGKAQTFVGIRDWDFPNGGKTDHHTGLVIVSRVADGWGLGSITLRPSSDSKDLDAMLAAQIREALQRHGLELADGKIGGALETRRLLDLLRDGQFTSALAIDAKTTLLR